MAVRRRKRNRARSTNVTAPATLPTTPPTIFPVVGGTELVGGWEGLEPVEVGPGLPVPPDTPPTPTPAIEFVYMGL